MDEYIIDKKQSEKQCEIENLCCLKKSERSKNNKRKCKVKFNAKERYTFLEKNALICLMFAHSFD